MLAVGTVLYGFCGGAFGRDSYDDKRVEAVGVDWVVARSVNHIDARAEFAQSDETGTDDIHEFLMVYTDSENRNK